MMTIKLIMMITEIQNRSRIDSEPEVESENEGDLIVRRVDQLRYPREMHADLTIWATRARNHLNCMSSSSMAFLGDLTSLLAALSITSPPLLIYVQLFSFAAWRNLAMRPSLTDLGIS